MRPLLKPAFVLMLTLLAGSEAVTRVFFARNMSGRFEYGYHPTAGFQENANGTVQLVRAGGRRFFPQSLTQTRPTGTFRIMTVGDSVSRGPNLRDAYPGQLGEQLTTAGLKVESLNLGLPGYGARRKEIVLRKALDYQPSLIILHVNNSNEYEDEREFRRHQEFASWHPQNWLMKSFIIRRLYEAKTEQLFWGWLPAKIRLQKALSDADAELSAGADAAKVRAWDERVRRATADCIALARARGVPILLVSQARLEKDASGQPHLDDAGFDRWLAGQTGEGVYHLSMKQVLAPLQPETLFADGAHLRPAGHKVLAAAIKQELLRAGLVH
jgi:hypothetical protein